MKLPNLALPILTICSSALAVAPIAWSEADRPVSLLPEFQLLSTSNPRIDDDWMPGTDKPEGVHWRDRLSSGGTGSLIGAGVGLGVGCLSVAVAGVAIPIEGPFTGAYSIMALPTAGGVGAALGGITGFLVGYFTACDRCGYTHNTRLQPPSLTLQYQPTYSDSLALTLDLRLLNARL